MLVHYKVVFHVSKKDMLMDVCERVVVSLSFSLHLSVGILCGCGEMWAMIGVVNLSSLPIIVD